jgi:hypothetical protein
MSTTKNTWDPDRPGCAPEICGGTSYDPCVTVMRTKGRWHDGQVPATAAEAMTAEAKLHSTGRGLTCRLSRCGHGLTDLDDWAAHIDRARLAAVADWLRAQQPVLLRTPEAHSWVTANRWAADLLGGA